MSFMMLQHPATISSVLFFYWLVDSSVHFNPHPFNNMVLKESNTDYDDGTRAISLDDELCKYCVSWYTLHVADVGVGLFLAAWNEHPIPCKTYFI